MTQPWPLPASFVRAGVACLLRGVGMPLLPVVMNLEHNRTAHEPSTQELVAVAPVAQVETK
jgi:hypothetical protein